MATAVGRKRRRGQREWSARLQTTTNPLLQVQFSQTRHERLDKEWSFQRCFCIRSATKNDKVMVVQRVCTKRGASLEWSWLDIGRKEKVTGGINIANGLELHEVTWCEFMQLRTSFEIASRRPLKQRRAECGGKASAGNSWSSATLQISFARFTAK